MGFRVVVVVVVEGVWVPSVVVVGFVVGEEDVEEDGEW